MRKLLPARALTWFVLACILAGYAISVIRLHPTNFFGFTDDDGIYFSSAQAIAQGRGYVLPSVPGTPPATKYPVLYPWILSWVWRWNPSFPANIGDAVAINILFGFAFLTAAFVFLRKMKGINDAEALALTGFCGLHPLIAFYTANIVTEIPFAAVALWAMIVAAKATKPDAKLRAVVFCGILAGLSTQLRFVGLAVVAGIALAALLRRAWRQFLVFSVFSGSFLAPGLWRAFFSPPAAPRFTTASAGAVGWRTEWAYYMNYPLFYRMSVPNTHVLLAMLRHNAVLLARGPSDYFLFPGVSHVVLGFVLSVVVTIGVLAGVLRQVRFEGWGAVSCALFFYMIIALVWDYPQFTRFFIVFLPLFAAGLWIEAKHVLRIAHRSISVKRYPTERVFTGVLGFAIIALLSANVLGRGRGVVAVASSSRATFLTAKKQAYGWISQFAPAGSRVVAYESASAYLYTGREAMRPVIFTVAAFYEPRRIPAVLDHITDVPRLVGAHYWIVAGDDYGNEYPAVSAGAKSRMIEIEGALPLVFSSSDDAVRIYDLGCLQHPENKACRGADRVLFPLGTPALPPNGEAVTKTGKPR